MTQSQHGASEQEVRSTSSPSPSPAHSPTGAEVSHSATGGSTGTAFAASGTATLGSFMPADFELAALGATANETETSIDAETRRTLGYERLERLLNIIIAFALLVVTAPLMMVLALAVKLTSPGPVIYVQPRVGLNRRGVRRHGRRRADCRWHLWAAFLAAFDDRRARDLGGNVFMIYKFRTMCVDAEQSTGAVWAVRDDPRSTPIGCFMRKYRLDELPQIFNVLNGEMNIVGPRPERPSIFARLRDNISDYAIRQRGKPGITGWAQIHLFYDQCVEDVRAKVRYDLEYLRGRTLRKDLKIMLKTLPAVLLKRRGW